MDIKRMHDMIEKLTECAKAQLDKGIEQVDAEEMSKVICMIKDLADAQYHRMVVVAMEESGGEGEDLEEMRMDDERRYYDNYRYANGRFAPKGRGSYRPRRGYEPMYYRMSPEMYRKHEDEPEWYRDMDRQSMNRMYYTENVSNRSSAQQVANDGSRMYSGDQRMYDGNRNMGSGREETRYDRARRNYTETKEMHKNNTAEDKQEKMSKLEEYMKELGSDLMDLVKDMTPEERSLAKTKVSTLATKL